MDDLLWRRILGGEGDTWLAAALLIGLLAVAAWQPERISRPGRFRWAYFLLAISLVLPAVAELVVRSVIMEAGESLQSRAAVNSAFIASAATNLAGKTLFALAIVYALGSLQLKPSGPMGPRVPPA